MKQYTTCENCGSWPRRNERYDAYYCPGCLVWLEPPCRDEKCEFCVDRPAKPPTQTE